MAQQVATFTVKAGPNRGDSVAIEPGGCRLVGRHLSDNETAFLDRDGNRKLDATAAQLLTEHMQPGEGDAGGPDAPGQDNAYTRGPDVILSDDAVSRAHAMVYFDGSGALGIIDLASTNGTFVNGQRITATALHPGDKVVLGSSHLAVALD